MIFRFIVLKNMMTWHKYDCEMVCVGKCPALSYVYYFGFLGKVSNKKTPLKNGIFNFLTASSKSKLLNGLFGNFTFLIEIMFFN